MKVLIAADMEGITGVVSWDHVTAGHFEYDRFRRLMTQDVNATIAGAFEGGADEVIVADGHGGGTNILIEQLDSRARINCSNSAPHSMVQGIDATIDGLLYVGYHARHGTPNAICDHTYSSKCITNLWLNGVLMGEYGLNAALAGYYGVPVIMISGDQAACAQAVELLGDLQTAVVKQATGRNSAECLPPGVTHKLISAAASVAVTRLAAGQAPTPYIVSAPVQVSVEFKSSDMVDRAMRMPGSLRAGLVVSLQLPDAHQAYMGFRSLLGLASL
jgi:D-amino peptidase